MKLCEKQRRQKRKVIHNYFYVCDKLLINYLIISKESKHKEHFSTNKTKNRSRMSSSAKTQLEHDEKE